jgi:hypothetical protein
MFKLVKVNLIRCEQNESKNNCENPAWILLLIYYFLVCARGMVQACTLPSELGP